MFLGITRATSPREISRCSEGAQTAEAPRPLQRKVEPRYVTSMEDALLRMQDAFYGLFENLPNRLVAWGLRLQGRLTEELAERRCRAEQPAKARFSEREQQRS